MQRHELVTRNTELQRETSLLNAQLTTTNEALAARVSDLEKQRQQLDTANRELAASYGFRAGDLTQRRELQKLLASTVGAPEEYAAGARLRPTFDRADLHLFAS